ncbi:MAG: MFS transporter [Acetobacteraceae bacterium]|nr:MFS transporter [Acetobacteraceae bacterium]
MRLFRTGARGNVLLLLCLMYFITYIDRVNVSSAAAAFKSELGLSNTQLGLVFSAFAYPYLVFQIIGGWFGDKFGARWTLTICGIVWAAATVFTGLAGGLTSLIAARVMLGFGEGATFPVATRAMSAWIPETKLGFAQGITHACARIGNALTPPLVVALMVLVTWRGSFIILGVISFFWALVWGWYFRDNPGSHAGVGPADLAALPAPRPPGARKSVPWGPLLKRMAPVTFVYFCYGWTLWTFLSWVPQFMLHNFNLNLKNSAVFSTLVFFGGVLGDALGGVVSDWLLRRTGSLIRARRDLVVFGMACSLACSLPILFVHDPLVAALSLSGTFFFAELTIGPMWSIPMDIAPGFAGTASGVMNTGSALAAIVSPVVFGVVIDATGNWTLPFIGTMVLMAIGVAAAFLMKPDRAFAD